MVIIERWEYGFLNFAVLINIVFTSVFTALRTRRVGSKVISEAVMKFA